MWSIFSLLPELMYLLYTWRRAHYVKWKKHGFSIVTMLPTHTVKAGHVLNVLSWWFGRRRIFGKVKVYHNWEKVKVFIESVDRFVWERCCESWRNKGFLVCLPPAHQSKQGQKHQKTMIFGKTTMQVLNVEIK